MLKLTILAVGKIKERYFRDALDEYLKRLGPYAKINLNEVAPESFRDNGEKEKSKKSESERIMKYLDKYPTSQVILLSERGKEYDSLKFSKLLKKNENEHLIFVIGGALGYSEELLNFCEKKLALSQMTFPHEMARIVLLEQIYRAMTIAIGKNYHY